MKLKIIIYCILAQSFTTKCIANNMHNTDTVKHKKIFSIAPYVGIAQQIRFGAETGLAWRKTNIWREQTFLTQINTGYEFLVDKHDGKYITAPKIGFDYAGVGHVMGSFGVDCSYYTNNIKSSPAITIRSGINVIVANLYVGYNMFLDPALRWQVGKYKVGLVVYLDSKLMKAL